jgi:hypothetical protein
VIEIVFELEEKFNIDISVKMTSTGAGMSDRQVELSALGTIGDICRMVKTLVDAKTSK